MGGNCGEQCPEHACLTCASSASFSGGGVAQPHEPTAASTCDGFGRRTPAEHQRYRHVALGGQSAAATGDAASAGAGGDFLAASPPSPVLGAFVFRNLARPVALSNTSSALGGGRVPAQLACDCTMLVTERASDFDSLCSSWQLACDFSSDMERAAFACAWPRASAGTIQARGRKCECGVHTSSKHPATPRGNA